MSMWNRAAQFAPFAALTGYVQSIQEANQENEELYKLIIDDKEEFEGV